MRGFHTWIDLNPRRNGWRLKDGVFDPAYVENIPLELWPALVFANACPTTDVDHMVADPLAISMLLNGVGHYISTFSPITDSSLSASFALQVYPSGVPLKAEENQWIVKRPESQFLWSLPA